MEQLRVQTGGATGGVDLSNGNATEVPPTTKVTEERARESGERESFNVLNLLDSNFMCGKCDAKNGGKDPEKIQNLTFVSRVYFQFDPHREGRLG